jgi:hypothetical protein
MTQIYHFTESDKLGYFRDFVALVHSALSFSYAYYAIFYSCKENESFFTDMECLHNNTFHYKSQQCLSMAYFTYDAILFFKYPAFDKEKD